MNVYKSYLPLYIAASLIITGVVYYQYVNYEAYQPKHKTLDCVRIVNQDGSALFKTVYFISDDKGKEYTVLPADNSKAAVKIEKKSMDPFAFRVNCRTGRVLLRSQYE